MSRFADHFWDMYDPEDDDGYWEMHRRSWEPRYTPAERLAYMRNLTKAKPEEFPSYDD